MEAHVQLAYDNASNLRPLTVQHVNTRSSVVH